MKSIICHTYSNYGFSFIYVILAYISSALSTPSCGLYGAPPCQFVPAPPGQTPACARPGRTYCEHVDNYPTYLIKHLVHKWGYEAKNLLVDETWDEFAALAWHETPIFYDPAFIFPHRHFGSGAGGGGVGGGHVSDAGAGGGGGGGAHGSDFGGYKYNTPGSHGAGPQGAAESTYIITKQQTTEPPTFLLYTGSGQRLNKNQVGYSGGGHKVSPNNPTFWLKRIVRDIGLMGQTVSSANHTTAATDTPSSESSSSRSTRDVSLNMDLLDIVGAEKGPKARTKRQSPGRSTLCQTTAQFITPQAALNSKGNWMFVVNEASTARQMVKAELCASNTCSNLCQLPSGYNSRCEQKFVQKRLIALQASGQNLYTDTFWFPSCCVCTLSTN